MTENQETFTCPPSAKILFDLTLNKLNTECTNLIGRNFGISKPNFEVNTIENYILNNEGNYFLIKTELEESYQGFMGIIFHLKDAIKIGGSLLGSDDNEIKENIKKDTLDGDYLDGMNEFGNQFSGMIDSVFRGKLPKSVHNKLSLCTPLDKDNVKDVLGTFSYSDCLQLSSLLLIKGFETGKFNMFVPLDLVEDFYGEQIHEKKTNVLILDDNMSDIRIVRGFLSNTEFKVMPATTIDQTFTILHKEKVHLILINYTMPEESGIVICRKIKKTPYTKGIPLIMLSSQPTEAAVIESLEAGARDFLVKPFTKDNLLKKIIRFKAKKKQEYLF